MKKQLLFLSFLLSMLAGCATYGGGGGGEYGIGYDRTKDYAPGPMGTGFVNCAQTDAVHGNPRGCGD